jgi:hypothetical protein
MASVAEILRNSDIIIDPNDSLSEIKEKIIEDNTPEVIDYIPSKAELDEHINKNIAEREAREKLQREQEAEKETCGNCKKFTRTTPNPKSQMANCVYHGVMVMKHQTGCNSFSRSKRNEDGGLWPS